jgi:hypothetical protein
VILFVNAPNAFALQAMPDLIEALDPASPHLPKYREWASQAQARAVASGTSHHATHAGRSCPCVSALTGEGG